MRLRAIVAYDGTSYGGFQRQTNAPTVQQALETALAQVTQEAIVIQAAGRTDAGVHAAGQVIAFDTAWRHTVDDLQRALNAVLPADIVLLEANEAALGFHPRYEARSRHYRYTVYNAPVRWPLSRLYSLHVRQSLDVEGMRQAARALVGGHDFAAFGQPPDGRDRGGVTIRQVLLAEWGGDPPWLTFDIEANAFLYRMVRSIIGTLLLVGKGKMTPETFVEILASCDRSQAGPTAPPQGLCLIEVKY
jgi:tRNA pseudouridine38-40 synthase